MVNYAFIPSPELVLEEAPHALKRARLVPERPECSAELLLLLAELAQLSATVSSGRDGIERGIAGLCANAPGIAARFRAAVDDMVRVLYARQESALAEFTAECAERTKVLQAQADELDVSAGQLEACVKQGRAALGGTTSLDIGQVLDAARRMSVLKNTDLRPRVPVLLDIVTCPGPMSAAVKSLSQLRRFELDPSRCVASGPGTVFFASVVANAVHVSLVDTAGLPATWLSADDVEAVVRVFAGDRETEGRVVSLGMAGGLAKLVFEVDDRAATEVEVRIVVGGFRLQPFRVCRGVSALGRLACTVNIDAKETLHDSANMAFTRDGSKFVISHLSSEDIALHDATDGSFLRCIRDGPQVNRFVLRPLCLTPSDNVLVAGRDGRFVDEMSLTGEHVGSFGHPIPGQTVAALAMHGNMVAVYTIRNFSSFLQLYSYDTRSLLRTFCTELPLSALVSSTRSLCFTRDGLSLVLLDGFSRVSMWTLHGMCSRVFYLGVPDRRGTFAMVLDGNDDIILCNVRENSVRVVSRHDGSLLRAWGQDASGAALFVSPTGLAVWGDIVYVLDPSSSRVLGFH